MNLDDQIAELLALPHSHRLAYAQPLVRQAIAEGKGQAGSGRGALPAEAWAACCRGAKPGEELDRALGEGERIGNGSIPESARVSAADALPIVEAIVRGLHARGRKGDGPVVIEATHVSQIVPDRMHKNRWGGIVVDSWRREDGPEAIKISGGWLPRPILVQPAANVGACPLGWAVAAWLQLRDGAGESPSSRMGKLWGKRGPMGPGAESVAGEEQLVVYRRRGEDGEVEGIAYGELTAKQVGELVRGDGALLPDDEVAASRIAEFEARAVEEREKGQRLPGEVDGLDAVWRHLGEQDRSRMSDEREREWKAQYELVRHLRSCKASSAEACRAREAARREGSRGKVESKLALWLRVIERLAAADLLALDEAADLERWGGFAARPEDGATETKAPPWRAAGREAARRLMSAEVSIARGSWIWWAAEELASRAILAEEKRHPPKTAAGREALATLRDRTGLGEGQAAADARRARGEASLGEVRIAADERAGLQVRQHATVGAASKDWAGPDVAHVLGRGEVAVVAPWPPRVLIGDACALVAAGYDRLVREEHAIQVTTGRDSLGWAGAENSRLLAALLGACAREVVAGREVPTAAEALRLARWSGAKRRPLATWRPVLVPLKVVSEHRDRYDPEAPAHDMGEAFPCEIRELKGDLLIRWRETFDLSNGARVLLLVDVTLGTEEWDLELADEAGREVSIDVLDFPDGARDLIQDRACGVRDWLRAEREGRSRSSGHDDQGDAQDEDTTDDDDQDPAG